MRSTIFAHEPELNQYLLHTTMTLKEWKAVSDSLGDCKGYEAQCFRDHIRKLVDKAEEQFSEFSLAKDQETE